MDETTNASWLAALGQKSRDLSYFRFVDPFAPTMRAEAHALPTRKRTNSRDNAREKQKETQKETATAANETPKEARARTQKRTEIAAALPHSSERYIEKPQQSNTNHLV